MIKTLEEIVKFEQQKYILENYIQHAGDYSNHLRNKIKQPIKPGLPYNTQIASIPNYDQKEYIKKAKAAGSGLGNFRSNCIVLGFAMASSVIGLLICWIPWVLAIFSWPFSIFLTRHKAYKMYIEDCQAIERKNCEVKNSIEEYNRKSVQYEKALNEYNDYQKTLPLKLEFFENIIEKAKCDLNIVKNNLQKLYDSIHMPSIARGFIPSHVLFYYIEKKRIESLIDATNLLEHEINTGKISLNIAVASKFRDVADEPLKYAIDTAIKCDKKVVSIQRALDNHFEKNNFDTSHIKFYSQHFEGGLT